MGAGLMFKAGRSRTLKLPRLLSAKVSRAPTASFARDGFNNGLIFADNFYNSDAWKKLRLQALQRDGYKCVKCPSRKNLEVHHIRSRTKDGLDALPNLQTLCKQCHQACHSHKIH
jgi:hypothetical protein